MSFILDSGFVYAQFNGKDRWHSDVSKAISFAEREPIILPVPAVTEIAYLLLHDLGVAAVTKFIESLADTQLILEAPTPEDYKRSSDILRKYNDANIDFVDACIVAMAERLNITKILTVDRPSHSDYFEIFP